jgi:general secretion pathway protein K
MVTAVMVVSVAAGVAAYLVANPERWGRQAANMAVIAQAEVTARAAVDWAREIVSKDSQGDASSRIGEKGPEVINTFPVENGELNMTLNDAQGKFNLNNMVKQGKASERDITMFKRLLAYLNLPQELANTVVDWMDQDDQPRSNGAESASYLALKPPYRAANRQLSEIGELTMIKGFTVGVVKVLSPYVTVLSDRALVNVNTAEAPVLMAVFKGLTLNDAESLANSRKSVRFSTVANLRERLPKAVTEVRDDDFALGSNYFTVTVISSFKHAKIRATALLRLGDKKYWPIVEWYRIT